MTRRITKLALALAVVSAVSHGLARADGFGPFRLPPIHVPNPFGAQFDRLLELGNRIKDAASPDALKKMVEKLLGPEFEPIRRAAIEKSGLTLGPGGKLELRDTLAGQALRLELYRLAVGDRREAEVNELNYTPGQGFRISFRLTHSQSGIPVVVRQSVGIEFEPESGRYKITGDTGRVESNGDALAAPLIEFARRLPFLGKTFTIEGKVPIVKH